MAQVKTYLLDPVCQVDAKAVKLFWLSCRKGNFGDAYELIQACKRLMASNNTQLLDNHVIEVAASWLANRYAA